ncbi:MAG TPA: histidine triad nucleotide-binding protein [Thermodesulfovibrionales bacterium]|nr:histidine triad nucleotide-binding protein [Thermodesulfovibrionales bacterium]
MSDCIFCRIVERKIPSKIVYEDETALAFKDINPQAPVHVLVIPKRHIPRVLDLGEEDHDLVGHLLMVANKIARDEGIAERGFRIVTNCNPESGQEVYHIHFHLLGGRYMHWPPG